MLRQYVLTAAVGCLPGVVLAGSPEACTPRCDVPQGYHCPPTCQPRTAPAAPAAPAPAGNFLRGPGTGQKSGESRSLGIRGPALHIPEIRLALPTLELPSPVLFTRDAEMLFDSLRGPLSMAAVQDYGAIPADAAPAPAAPTPATPEIPPAPQCTPACVPLLGQAERLEATLARLEALEQELATLRSAAAAAQYPVPQPQAMMNGGAKPASNAGVKGSRPLPPQHPQFMQAGYEEPATERAAPKPATASKPMSRPASARFGLSNPSAARTAQEPDQFGAWSRSSR